MDKDSIDYRAHPELYEVGRGEKGVFHVEPYKSELLPLWAFRTPDVARTSAEAIYARYLEYRSQGDFVGMDMARKYLQIGYTRARRCANHRGGRKYSPEGDELPRGEIDGEKAEAAAIFKAKWRVVADDEEYQRRKRLKNKALLEIQGRRPENPLFLVFFWRPRRQKTQEKAKVLIQKHRLAKHVLDFGPVVFLVVEFLDIDALEALGAGIDWHSCVLAILERSHAPAVALQ